MKRIIAVGSLAAAVACGAVAAAAQEMGTQIAVAESPDYGAYLTDQEGRAVYMFTADQQGTEGQPATSNCYEACAEAWPPVTATGEPQAGEQAQAEMLGTIEREDGTTQVTYGGWPLYYFVQDAGPGQVTGQDKQGFGGEWYLVGPEGEPIEEEQRG